MNGTVPVWIRKWFLFSLALPLVIAGWIPWHTAASEPPVPLYRVVIAEEHSASVEEALNQNAQGASARYQSTDGTNLLLGQFEYYADAFAIARHYRRNMDVSAKVEPFGDIASATAFSTISQFIPPIFKQPESRMSETPDLALPPEDPLVLRIEALQDSPRKAEYRRVLSESLAELSDSDVRKGFVLTRLGIADLLERKFEDALEALAQVADGQVAATRVDRIKSMRRIAWILHQQKKRFEAYQAYREIERFTGSDLVRVIAGVECAGLLMELARSDVGSLEDCRRECRKVIERITMLDPDNEDPDYRKYRATAELMYFETFYYEKRYEIAAQLADQFVDKYRDRPRELSMALLFQACAHKELGRYPQAKEALVRLLQTEFPSTPEESWGSHGERWNMKTKAAQYLKKFSAQFADPDGEALANAYLEQ